ncbi:MAG: NfeD family protein [Erysipelotrichaceae bacterium]|jgi:membrane protein implicated in regulation of membrane protease activity|nr:NfeD family protein [Erysipelotrichaceae bacterium]
MTNYIWLIISAAALFVEVITPLALVSVWFIIGGLAAQLIHLLNIGFIWEVLTFIFVSLIALILLRPVLLEMLRGNTIPTNQDRAVGQKGKLIKAISEENWGEIKILGSVWSCVEANHKPLAAGTEVIVLKVDGAKLIVAEINK